MVQIEYKGKVIASNVSVADNFIDRLMGYMFRAKPHRPGILFEPAPSIHTFFMNFSLDVVFLDANYQVLKIYRNMRPWRHTWFHLKSKKTLEVPAGAFPADIKEGDVLEVRNV
jgi:uncharacterized membrane protein (UPF0127 family)